MTYEEFHLLFDRSTWHGSSCTKTSWCQASAAVHNHSSKHANIHSAVHYLLCFWVLCWVLCYRWSDWIRERVWWNRWIKRRRSKWSFVHFLKLCRWLRLINCRFCSQATSRLLVNYEEPYRSQILDFLFKVLGHVSDRCVTVKEGRLIFFWITECVVIMFWVWFYSAQLWSFTAHLKGRNRRRRSNYR